jgi:hypothetical protein
VDTDGDTVPDFCDCEGLECGDNAHCEDSGGGPECVCDDGYEGDGFTCTDIDECTLGTDTCDTNATCTNTDGGYTCACNDGYDGDGFTCTDIDECTLGTDTCNTNATCTNTDGGYTCACNTGYDGDGFSCTDIDECARGTDTCDTNATCTNTDGGYTCACDTGYSGDGFTCAPIDHCSAGTHTCHTHATCTYTGPGTYDCDCNPGFTGDGFTCTVIPLATGYGQAIMIGHDYYSSNASMDAVVGNAVLMANTTGTINVLGYTQYSDTTGEVANTNAAVTTHVASRGRTVSFSTPLTDYTLLDSRLPGNDVLIIYEMERGGTGSTIGAAWASTLLSFVTDGGIVIAMSYYCSAWEIMDSAGLLELTSAADATGSTINVVASSDPLAVGVTSPYSGLSGTTSFVTPESGVVNRVSGGNPVVIRKEYAESGCLDGSSEVVWSTDYHACGGPVQSWRLYADNQHDYCAAGWVMANESVVNDELTGPGYTADVQYAYNGEACTESTGLYFATRNDAISQSRPSCGWSTSHHWAIGSDPISATVDGIVCQRVPGRTDMRYTGTAGPDIGSDWIQCGRVTSGGVDPLLSSTIGPCLVRGLREWAVARSGGVCTTGNQEGWEYPEDNASRTLDYYLDYWSMAGWISPSHSGSNVCGLRSSAVWSTTTLVSTWPATDAELFVYYHR